MWLEKVDRHIIATGYDCHDHHVLFVIWTWRESGRKERKTDECDLMTDWSGPFIFSSIVWPFSMDLLPSLAHFSRSLLCPGMESPGQPMSKGKRLRSSTSLPMTCSLICWWHPIQHVSLFRKRMKLWSTSRTKRRERLEREKFLFDSSFSSHPINQSIHPHRSLLFPPFFVMSGKRVFSPHYLFLPWLFPRKNLLNFLLSLYSLANNSMETQTNKSRSSVYCRLRSTRELFHFLSFSLIPISLFPLIGVFCPFNQDGSSNIDCLVSIGSIFAVYKKVTIQMKGKDEEVRKGIEKRSNRLPDKLRQLCDAIVSFLFSLCHVLPPFPNLSSVSLRSSVASIFEGNSILLKQSPQTNPTILLRNSVCPHYFDITVRTNDFEIELEEAKWGERLLFSEFDDQIVIPSPSCVLRYSLHYFLFFEPICNNFLSFVR